MRRNLEHIVRFEAGHDCIKFECRHGAKDCYPGSEGSHGRNGVGIRFVSKGPEGAIQFLIYSGWMPQYSEPGKTGSRFIREWGSMMMPADLGYHSKTPQYEAQNAIDQDCEYCDGQPCYYDGSSLNASDAMYALVNGGGEALWKFLDAYYATVFDGADYPVPAEYPMPPRQRKAQEKAAEKRRGEE